jgi:hypothetical protein
MTGDGDGHRRPLASAESLNDGLGDFKASHRLGRLNLGAKLHDLVLT